MQFEISGDDEVKALLDAMSERLRNLQPVLEVIAQDTKTLIDNSFESSKSPDGSPWAPLKPATIAARRGDGVGAKPLVDTGRLRNSITTKVEGSALKFGTNVKYAGPHQFGNKRIPARTYLPVVSNGGVFVLMQSSVAGEHWRQALDAVAHFIRTGEIV